METKQAGKIVREKVRKSVLNFEGTDFRWLLVYLTLTMSPANIVDAKVQDILPWGKS